MRFLVKSLESTDIRHLPINISILLIINIRLKKKVILKNNFIIKRIHSSIRSESNKILI